MALTFSMRGHVTVVEPESDDELGAFPGVSCAR